MVGTFGDCCARARAGRFETYTKFRDFKAFHIEQAKGFKASLADQTSVRTKEHREARVPTLEQIRHVIRHDAGRYRDRAPRPSRLIF
jgi:hypothetical protein